MVSLLLLCALSVASWAAEPALYPSVPLEALLHHARLAEAAGEERDALDYLGALEARLLAGETLPPAETVGALALLGDLRLRAGDVQGAEAAFRLLAGRFPGQVPCPACPDCERTVPLERWSPPVLVTPSPEALGPALVDHLSMTWAYAPLGAPQFAQHRPGAGLAWGGAQLALGGASVALFAHLAARKDAIEDGEWSSRSERRDATGRWEWAQLGVQVPVTIAFYGSWAGSVLEARRWPDPDRPGTGP